ncbi:hypothetical protein L5515_005799 [Caenorhabditis briggsae]|nr:hypothetical protein L5515_005799 [Caenorhabditis briggsae]
MEVSSSEATTGAEVIADEMSRTDASRSNEPRKKFADQRHKYDVCVRNEETLVRIGPSNHGQGAFATATIPRGTRVAIYDGQSFGVLAFGVIIMDLMLVYGPHVPEFDIWMSGILISLIFLTFALVCEAGIKGGYIFFSIGAWFLSLIRIK